ncbi:hypothetical protein BC835DRAFT_705136 [Cytidiella melzeri]|nr:hypothetical protein BC835DRAFT_705136 [Cytidiella melzeri]
MRFATHLTAQHPRRRRESQSPTRTQQSREPSLRTQVFMRNISRLSQANLYACAAKSVFQHESTIGRRGRQAMSRPSSTVDHLPLDKQGDDGHRLVSTRASSRGKFRSSAETKDQQNISSSQKKTQSREEAGKALGSKTAVGRVTRGIVRMDAHRGSCQQEQSSVPRKRKLQDPIVPPAKRSRGPFAIEDIRPAMIRRLASKSSGQHPSIAKYGGLTPHLISELSANCHLCYQAAYPQLKMSQIHYRRTAS